VSFGDLGLGNSGSSNIWRVKKLKKERILHYQKKKEKKKKKKKERKFSFLARGVKGEGESG
jgi:hypothetical protein